MEFVVGASQATMKSVLGKLGSLLAQEYALIRGIQGDIQYINDELASIQAFLGDLGSASGGHDRRLKDWMKQIRDMAYDMEDCVDDFAHRIPHDSVSDGRCSVLVIKIQELWTFLPRREICSKVADLKVRAQQIAERRNRYGVTDHGNASAAAEGTPSGGAYDMQGPLNAARQLFRTEKPLGMGENVKEFTAWLTRDNGHFEKDPVVLSIVGFGGMGKTTIATALYREYRNDFDCRATVTVSQNYDESKFLREILGQIKPKDQQQGGSAGSSENDQAADRNSSMKQDLLQWICGRRQQRDDGASKATLNSIETMKRDQLVQELNKRLTNNRYILLIDDIWSADTWEKIRVLLQNDNTEGSRVIVTTRFQAVAERCSETDGTDRVLIVGALVDEDSETLFNQCVSASKNIKDSWKEGVHEKIWKYCGGLPLAIVTMAGLVACNPSKKEEDWSKVCQSLLLEQSAPLTLQGVKRILDYCYNDLPADLKTCSLFLCIFPKGSKVSRKRLIRRWISECFASEKEGMTEEEVAEAYFDQLIRRNIIRPMEHSSNGKIKSFKVHDMVLEYIVAKSCEENFITVVGGHWLMPMPSNKVRRLSMQSKPKHGDSTRGMNLSHVRSLTVFGNQNRMPFHSFNDGIIQVLDLEDWNGLEDKHLRDICKMLVLKYLSVRRTGVKVIPSKIEKLQYLETLDIRETNVEELPRSANELKRLQTLLGGSKNPPMAFKLPGQDGNKEPMAPALGILSGIEIDESSSTIESLHKMTGLRKLAIYKLDIEEGGEKFKQLRSSIEYLCSCGLQSLAINDDKSGFIDSLNNMSVAPKYLIALELSGMLGNPPNWIKDLKNLYKITLSVTVLRTPTFHLLQNLPKLFSLTFSLSVAAPDDREKVYILEENKLPTGREIIVPPGGFGSLKLLRFFATLVPRLSFTRGAMPNLERIDMRFKAFEGIYGIENIGKLQEVHISVDNQADEITRKLIEDLKYTTKFFVDNLEDPTKGPKIIMD